MLLGLFAVAAVTFLAWLLFAFAVYAMPLMIGVTATSPRASRGRS